MLIPKSDNDTQKRKLQDNVPEKKKETKILNKILSSQVQLHFEKTIGHYLLRPIPLIERRFNTEQSTITIHYINRMK